MEMTALIRRMATHPDPTEWFSRQLRRMELASVQPVDDPDVVITRPYGVGRGLGVTTMPVDYTLSHFGGTLRGAKIGQWKENLMVAPDPQPVNAPTLFSWRGSYIRPFTTQWELDTDDIEEL